MNRSPSRSFGVLLALLTLLCGGLTLPLSAAESSRNSVRFAAGPATGDALDIALGYLGARDQKAAGEVDFNSLVLRERYTSSHNSTTHLYWTQQVNGLEIANRVINVNVSERGEVINQGGRLLSSLEQRRPAPPPSRSAREAVFDAAERLGLAVSGRMQETQRVARGGVGVAFRAESLSTHEIPVTLKYFALESGELRLAWDLVIATPDRQHIYNVFVDTETGELLARHDWVANESYQVYAFPKESPSDGGRTIESGVADASASPFGWHDTNGAAGADFTDTRGNNVFAQEDADANNSGGFRPSGGAGLDFLFPIDLAQDPTTYQEAVITNLFYWNNVIHDILWHYGFDEQAGNFQENNYGRGGAAGDAVNADAQDGSGTNNANFSTPPEGGPFDPHPRMQMFIWTPSADHQLTVNSPPSIAADYTAGGAEFGATLSTTGITGDLELANDGTAPAADGCEALQGFTSGRIAVIDRGTCSFVIKVKNAQDAGASAVVVVNNQGDGVISMGGADASITISSVMIGQSDGDTIKAELGGGVNATAKFAGGAIPSRDSDLDNGVIAHEYGHGLSIRLTGGSGNSNCLSGDQQAGEGWSDFLALALTAEASDQATTSRGIGTYVNFEASTGSGIRQYPYTTDMGVNLHTYADIGSVAIPHGVGSVWAAMVWEVYWNLVDVHGFDPDLKAGSGGNNIALQLVIDGLKLQPCSPTFVDARDAILLADQNNNGGANQCAIWEGFAKRGLGQNADDGGSSTSLAVTEDFTVPAFCAQTCGNNVIEGTEVCDGGDLGGQSCSSQSCTGGGTLACNATCDGFDTSSCFDCPTCNFNGICELGEDCGNCASDCVGGSTSGAVCGNGLCEAGDGENCVNCAADCNGRQSGKPANRFCCGDGGGANPVACSDNRCSSSGFSCTDQPSIPGSFCCGDLACDSGESCANCGLDCATGAELCSDGIDNDCNGDVDCADFACLTAPACQGGGCTLGQIGDSCTANGDCCSNKCKGPTGGKTCK